MIKKGLKLLLKISVLLLQALIAFASEDKRPRMTAGKAAQLYEDGVIGEEEFAEHINRD